MSMQSVYAQNLQFIFTLPGTISYSEEMCEHITK